MSTTSASSSAPGKRERNKAHNRAEILVAAREVFAELGYDAATVRDIIRRTRLASGTFYNYFPDKESVFRALLHDTELRRRERLRAARLSRGDMETFVGEGFRIYFQYVAEDRQMFELLRRNSQTIRAFSDDPVLSAGLERLRRHLRSAFASGELRFVDPEYLASAMFGVAFEVAVRMVERSPVDVEGATDFATTLFLGGLERARAAGRATSRRPRAKRRGM
jgi:AcrR family transcriptional regulator